MLRCTQSHEVPTFGTIPKGSLWADDSPFVTDVGMFEPVADAEPELKPKPVVRKFKPGGGAKPAPAAVGEHGPEIVTLPAGAVIIPTIEGEAV